MQTSDLLAAVERVANQIIGPHAASVDRDARFPAESIAALADCGALGVLSDPAVGGLGLGLGAAGRVIERVARECGSTAMVATMHLCGVAVLERYAPEPIRRDAARGTHLSTLAFSEAGSRSHFWAPLGTATRSGNRVTLAAKKSWITSANHATAYVWSSRSTTSDSATTLWLVPRDTAGVAVSGGFDGLGLRGNDSCPAEARGAELPMSAILGDDGGGADIMLGTVLPVFQVLNASCSVGLMEAAIARTIAHATSARLEHLGTTLADNPVTRAHIARMRVAADGVRGLLVDALDAIEHGRADASLRVLESKAIAGDTAARVLDTAMRVCGGAAFRKEAGVERYFRDARAAAVMAPTSDALYEFIGRSLCGLPLF